MAGDGAGTPHAQAAVQRLASDGAALPLYAAHATKGHDTALTTATQLAAAGPLLLQRSRAVAAPQDDVEPMGLDALFAQSPAASDGSGGGAATQSAEAGGGGENTVGGQEASGEQEASGTAPLGHPRTWSAEVLDELSRRLYAGISRRMKQELRTDRERAGRLMDLRR